LLSICGAADTVAVGIEVPHGPVVDTLIDRGFVLHAINPKQLDRLRDRISVAGAKDDRRDAYSLADGVRTDRRLFRGLHVSDPRLVELRAWSRLAEELTDERVRLSNRVHHELWRYYPQLLQVSDDLTEPWILDLWDLAPTPGKARRLRPASVEKLLKKHRIRRIDADAVLRNLQEPAIKVGPDVAEAAGVHLRLLFTRLRIVNRELRQAGAQLDKLCAAIGYTDADTGEGLHPRDVMILRSMPGIGRINLATLLCEGSGPLSRRDYQALRPLWGLRRSPSAAASRTPSSCATPRMSDCAEPSITGRASPHSTIRRASSAMPRCVGAANRTVVRSEVSPTGCLASRVSCSNDRRRSIRTWHRPSSRRVARSHQAANPICP